MDIRIQFVLFNSAIIVVMGLLLWPLKNSLNDGVRSQQYNIALKVQNTLGKLREAADIALGKKNRSALNRIAQDYRIDEDFAGIVILDPEGTVLANVGVTQALARHVGSSPKVPGPMGVDQVGAFTAVEFDGVHLGTIGVAYSTKRVNATRAIVDLLQWLFLCVAIAAWASGVWLADRIVTQLRAKAEILRQTALDLRTSTLEISGVVEHTEAQCADEFAAIEETRRTMQDLTRAADEILDSSRQMASTATYAAQASERVSEQFIEFRRQAEDIGTISKMISTIADRGDILSLNASLEGTRAGEAGAGFVALGEELRILAETVTEAAREINGLANEAQELSDTVSVIAHEGQRLAEETLLTAKHIESISDKQRGGTRQITRSMDDVQGLTKNALDGAQRTKAAIGDLLRMADNMRELVATASGVRVTRP